MIVAIQKVDLDTALTALLVGVKDGDRIVALRENAPDSFIFDPEICCIEAGGSGLTQFNNFDHHDPSRYFPPASKQAYTVLGLDDPVIERLVEYVSTLDERPDILPRIPFPSLSSIFSGMLLCESNPVMQLFAGISILTQVLCLELDPFSTIPILPVWEPYIAAKTMNREILNEDLNNVQIFESKTGLKIGFLESRAIGGTKALFSMGCDIAILYNPSYGNPPVRKFTIASRNKKLVNLLTHFDNIETGWGGRETIIGSPRTGTNLKKEDVLDVVLSHM